MAARGAILTEDDGPDDGTPQRPIAPPAADGLPEGLGRQPTVTGGNFLMDLQQAEQTPQQYEIIDGDATEQQQDERVGAADAGGAPQIEVVEEEQPRRRERVPQPQRRAIRREARDRTLSELEATRAEVAELRARLQGIEPRLGEIDAGRQRNSVANIEREIDNQASIAAQARRQMFEHQQAGDIDAAGDALDRRDAAIMKGQQLTAQRNMLVSGNPFSAEPAPGGRPSVQQQPRVAAAPVVQPTPPAVQRHVTEFMGDFPWYNPNNFDDPVSMAVSAIDRAVMKEGYDPAGPDYWDEMRSRMEAVLPPDAFPASDMQPAARQPARGAAPVRQPMRAPVAPQRRGPQMAAPADRAPSNGRVQVVLTSDRKLAMQESGVLAADGRTVLNPTKFQRQLESYRRYDAENGETRR